MSGPIIKANKKEEAMFLCPKCKTTLDYGGFMHQAKEVILIKESKQDEPLHIYFCHNNNCEANIMFMQGKYVFFKG